MNIVTGEELSFLKVPERPRRQFSALTDYLNEQSAGKQSVCALYGLRRTGKTTLILQAIKKLIAERVAPECIGYFTGKKGDTFDDLIAELDAQKKLRYVFIDEVGYFSNFLNSGSYLYDTLVRLHDKKVVIAGTNLLAMYLAGKQTLYDRCNTIRMPYLSFYEHCSFVLNTENPAKEDLMQYLQTGGLFQKPEDIVDYVQTSITNSITELFETEPESDIFPWLRPESDEVDWKGYVNAILLLSSNYVGNTTMQVPVPLRDDVEAIDADISRKVLRDFRQYFSLQPRDRDFRMKRTETVALLDFLTHCGAIMVLPNLYYDAEPYRCYVQTPFLRFHFTQKMREMTDGALINGGTPLFGKLLEAAVISEYQESHPAATICFARTHHPQGSDNVAEIDLLDMEAKTAYEIKLSRARGYKGFELLEKLPELRGFVCTMLDDKAYTDYLYRWGQEMYSDSERLSLESKEGPDLTMR